MRAPLSPAPSPAPRRTRLVPAAAVLLLGLAMLRPAAAADDAQAPLKAQLERIDTLRAQRPGDGLLVYYRAMTLAALNRRDDALDALRSLRGRKLGLVPAAGMGFDALWDDPVFRALRDELAADEPRTGTAPQRWQLPDVMRLPEGIAFDARKRQVFIGSIWHRRIDVVDAAGRVRPFSRPEDGLDAVLGLHVDRARQQLLAVSTSALATAGAPARNAVLRYALRGPHRVQRLDAPGALQLNDVVALADGTVLATDSAGSSLYRARPGEPQLTPFGERGKLPGANGIAAAPDGSLYVAVSTGIVRIDPDTGQPQRLAQPDTLVSGGIDGLYWHDGDLVGIQNAGNPGRVVRLHLANGDPAEGGRRIAALTVLQSHHHPLFAEPTTGAIAGDKLLVIANSHVAQLQPDGTLRDASALQPTRIVAVPLRRTGTDRGRAAAARNGTQMARHAPPNWPLRPAGVLSIIC
jgi:sugar lactone lactonase YvrE